MKITEEESLTDANNVTADTLSHASNAKKENPNAIFTSENLNKLGELVNTVKNLTINDAKYYESDAGTVSEAQIDLTRDPETVTHTSKGTFEKNIELPDHTCLALAD